MIRSIVIPNGVYAEVGVFKGDFSDFLFRTLSPKQLVLIDYFTGDMGSGNQDGNNYELVNLDAVYKQLVKKYETHDNVTLLKGDSVGMLSTFEDNTFDMIYIDADHSYEGAKRDIQIAYNKLKHGGWLMGHDYEMNMRKAKQVYHFGVKQAVDEFCQECGQTIYAKGYDGCVSFAIQISKA